MVISFKNKKHCEFGDRTNFFRLYDFLFVLLLFALNKLGVSLKHKLPLCRPLQYIYVQIQLTTDTHRTPLHFDNVGNMAKIACITLNIECTIFSIHCFFAKQKSKEMVRNGGMGRGLG